MNHVVTDRAATHSRRLAWASVIAGVVAWIPMLVVLLDAAMSPPAKGEIEGMAAMAAAFFGVMMLGGGAVIGTVLGVLAVRRTPRHPAARWGLAINGVSMLLILGVLGWMFRPR
jgi:hypothetical protein